MTLRLVRGKSLRDLKAELRRLPLSVAHDVAKQAAPLLTQFTQTAFDTGRNVYGDPRPKGENGETLTLKQTGTTRRALRFVANGTIIRASLGPRYARYLVGKYKILPVGDRSSMPRNWVRAIDELVRTALEGPAGLRRLAA